MNSSSIIDIKSKLAADVKKLKDDLKSTLNSPDTFKFEKESIKDKYKFEKRLLQKEAKLKIKRIKNPESFQKNQEQKALEQAIVALQQEFYNKLDQKEKETKRALRKATSKVEKREFKQDFKNYKLSLTTDFDKKINETKSRGEINYLRHVKNTITVKAIHANNKVLPTLGKIANQKHLMAIRNAFSSLIPFIMIASFITIIRSIPCSLDPNSDHAYLYTYFPKVLDDALVVISSLTMGIMALALAIAVGINLGQNYGESPLISGMMGLLGFILWVGPEALLHDKNATGLPLSDLGSRGLFVSLVMSIVMFELYRVFKKYRITIRLPKGVPPAVSNSFIAIIPAVIYAMIVLSIRYVAGFSLIDEMETVLKPIGSLINDNFGAVILVILFNSLFWWFGIHGSAITGIITYPFWYPAIAENQEWWNNGAIGEVPNHFVEPYYQWMIWIGGSGSTIGLAICAFFFSKSRQNKALGKATIVPAIFNISEPMMFGFPVVLNVFLFIPFMLASVACTLVSLAFVNVFHINWVTIAPWSLPGPIGAFLASENNFWAIIGCLLSVCVATLVYLPFYKAFDRSILKEEQANMKIEAEKAGMEVNAYMRKLAIEENENKLKSKKRHKNAA